MTKQDKAISVGQLTLQWIRKYLEVDECIIEVEVLYGGITAEVRKLKIGTPTQIPRHLVLRSYTASHVLHYAEDWLNREADALTQLSESGVLAPELVAVDPTAKYCDYPSLLMSHLPGATILLDEGLEARVPLLARQLVTIHELRVAGRPRECQTLTTAETAVIPPGATAEMWAAAVDVIRGPTPPYEGRFLHRDFQPGNILVDASPRGSTDADVRISGVVDWAGACWGPADLDVAHCSTNLALLHGPEWGLRFGAAYEEAGGVLSATAKERQYWRVRDGLACSEEVQLWAQPWREAGRADLTPSVVEARLDGYMSILMSEQA